MDEKTAMGDGEIDRARLIDAVRGHAREARLFDMAALAKQSGSIISAVMLGAIAGSGRLPLDAGMFEAVIRADGKSTNANLRGFHAGFDAVRTKAGPVTAAPRNETAALTVKSLEAEAARSMPAAALPIVTEGIRRLAAYQDIGYAQLYMTRLAAIRDADEHAGAAGKLLSETARHLAVRMSYEDVIRVAAAKIAPDRIRRIARDELRAKAGEPFTVHDFLKPGIEELCQVLPPVLAKPILALAKRKGWLGRVYFGMEVDSTSVSGYLRFLMLAKLRRFRRLGYRYAQEQAQIESWLLLVVEAAKLSAPIALEVVECARLIKGYGDTHARGSANFRAIETNVIRPILSGHFPVTRGADAIASARTAALLDPDGEKLAQCIAEIGGQAGFRAAAE
jgi:indolepyruvate ferredoxin oxidoreductase beta subunit